MSNQTYRSAEHVYYDITDFSAIVINSLTGEYYILNRPASFIFDALATGITPDALKVEFAKHAGCPSDFSFHFEEFLQNLIAHQLIVPVNADPNATQMKSVSDEVLKEGFGLDMKLFTDAAEILLADPIHDVEIDKELGLPTLKEKPASEEN